MNLILKKQLPRRTFLRGMGSVVALPILDAMVPALVRAAGTASPTRMAILYFPNGVQMDTWQIATEGQIAPLPDVLPRTHHHLLDGRDIETRIQKTERDNALNPEMDRPSSSVPEHYNEHTRIIATCKLASGVSFAYFTCRPRWNSPLPLPVSSVGRLSWS